MNARRRTGAASQGHAGETITLRSADGAEVWGALQGDGEALPATRMPNGRCKLHGGKSPGPPKGNRNAWKQGRYSADAIGQSHDLRARAWFLAFSLEERSR